MRQTSDEEMPVGAQEWARVQDIKTADPFGKLQETKSTETNTNENPITKLANKYSFDLRGEFDLNKITDTRCPIWCMVTSSHQKRNLTIQTFYPIS